jgi:hypothetical protein
VPEIKAVAQYRNLPDIDDGGLCKYGGLGGEGCDVLGLRAFNLA